MTLPKNDQKKINELFSDSSLLEEFMFL